MKKVVILRGIPGSGKTTLAHELIGEKRALMVSADDYFTDSKTGEYKFDPSNIGAAHGFCFNRAIVALREDEVELLVVHNTSISHAEIAPYVLLAQSQGYECEIVTLECWWETAFKRQAHGVPAERVKTMWAALNEATEDMPPWWNHRVQA